MDPALLQALMEYILNRQTAQQHGNPGGDMPNDQFGMEDTIGGLGAAAPPPVDMGGDNTISAMSAGNPARHDTSPSTYGGPPPRQQTLGELLALHGLYDPGPARPMPGRAAGPQPRPVAGPAGNAEPKESNRANTPPRTGVLPNGNAFPGQGRDNSVSAKPDPQARPVTPRVPLGLQSPRNLPPSYTPERARPAAPTRPIPARGISYPIQAAKRIQQAAVQPQARPQIAKPMSPGTLRSLTRR
jgi:hypothetical protein